LVPYKDHIEKIDFQELIFAVVNWPNSELYWASVCIMYYLTSLLYKSAGQCFPDCGVWVSVDFDSKCKILCGETRAHGVPIHEEEKKFKTRIYIIVQIFTPPTVSD